MTNDSPTTLISFLGNELESKMNLPMSESLKGSFIVNELKDNFLPINNFMPFLSKYEDEMKLLLKNFPEGKELLEQTIDFISREMGVTQKSLEANLSLEEKFAKKNIW